MFVAAACLLLLVAEGASAGLIGACGPCTNHCPYGYDTSAARCSCTCRPPPCRPLYKCDLVCPNGLKKDENGCSLCQCQCPELGTCPSCPYGYLPVNATACPQCPKCVCHDDPCPLECAPQYRTFGPLDVYGCPTCSCIPPECPSCECHGNIIELPPQRGHECLPCPPCPCYPVSYLECLPPSILKVELVHGCPQSRCEPPSCITTPCPSECAKVEYTFDSNGCATCHCDWSSYCTPCPYPCPTVAGVTTTARPGGNNGPAKRDVGPYGCPDCSLCAP